MFIGKAISCEIINGTYRTDQKNIVASKWQKIISAWMARGNLPNRRDKLYI